VRTRTLRRLGIPALLFVNKIDRGGAGPRRVLRDIGEKLAPRRHRARRGKARGHQGSPVYFF